MLTASKAEVWTPERLITQGVVVGLVDRHRRPDLVPLRAGSDCLCVVPPAGVNIHTDRKVAAWRGTEGVSQLAVAFFSPEGQSRGQAAVVRLSAQQTDIVRGQISFAHSEIS